MIKRNLVLLITLFFFQLTSVSSAQEPGLFSLGISGGGSGIAGIPFQVRPLDFLAVDLGVYFRASRANTFDEPKWYFGPAVDAGLSVLPFRRGKSSGLKTVYNGIYFKGGIGTLLTDLKENSFSLGWVREIYPSKHPGRFVQLQLGPSVLHRFETRLNPRYPPGDQEQTEEWTSAMIYFRLSWFFL